VGSKRVIRGLFVVAVSVALVLVGFMVGAHKVGSSATPSVITGRIGLVGINGNEFRITPAGSKSDTSYGLSTTTPWRDSQLVWNSGSPILCMRPLSHGQTVTIGVVNTKPTSGASGTAIVAWVECTI
jgi:hypothetical protein